MEFFKRKIMYPRNRTDATSKAIDKLFKDYESHFRAIRNSLPESARSVLGMSFHDAEVIRAMLISKKVVELVIEGEGVDIASNKSLGHGKYTLQFSGVKKAWIPSTIIGDIWLYEEAHLSDIAAFDYQVLLGKDEIRIQADVVSLKKGS